MTKILQADIRVFLLPITVSKVDSSIYFLFSQNQVVEILGQQKVHLLPFAPVHASGVINYFDQLLPVINLEALFNGRGGGLVGKQHIILRTGASDPKTGDNLKVALHARSRLRMAKLDSRVLQTAFTEMEPPSALAASGLIRGYFERGNNRVALLDLPALISPNHRSGSASATVRT